MSSVRIDRDDDEALVVRVAIGSSRAMMGRAFYLILGMYVALGFVALYALDRTRTLTCDAKGCALHEKGIVDEKSDVVPRDQVIEARVDQQLGKCRLMLATRRGDLNLRPNWTVRCIMQRGEAKTINAFLRSPTEPPLVIRFEERTMFLIYTYGYFGSAVVFLFIVLWPESLFLQLDRRKRVLTFRKITLPWRRKTHVVPVARVKELVMRNYEDSHLLVELALDDGTTEEVRSHDPIADADAAPVRDRVQAVLAELR